MPRKFGPLKNLPPNYEPCAACKKPFKEGDYSTLVVLGPGDNEESRLRAKEGRPYNAVAAHVHWECAGEPNDY